MRKLACLALAAVLLATSAAAAATGYDLPVTDAPGGVTVRLAVTDMPGIEDWETNEFVKWWEEQTNVDFEFELIPLEGRAEKLGLILASGNYPDAFMSVGLSDAMMTRYGVTEGMFRPLNDLIEEYGVGIKKVFESYPGSEGLITQLDGNIYSLPTVNECYHCTVPEKFWINKAWLENLGLETPTTTDELYEVLKAFKENDANGNGDPDDEIPLTGTYIDGWGSTPDMFLMSAFTFYPLYLDVRQTTGQLAFGLYVEDGEVTVPFYKPEIKDGLKYIAKLYKEGLVYPGTFTQNLNTLTALTESGQVGASPSGYIMFAEMGGEKYREFEALTPIEGPNGFRSQNSYPHDSVGGHYFFVSAESEVAEEAFKAADLLYDFEASMRAYYGVKGVDWDDPDEGAVGINGLPALYKILTPWQETKPQNQHVVQMSITYRDAAFRLGEPSDPSIDLYAPDGLETLLYKVSAEQYRPYATDEKIIPPLKFTDEEVNAMSVIKTELASGIREGMTTFMTGEKDVDTEFDGWVKELQSKGLDTLIGYYQSAYDAQYK
ncbi:MAG: extracellular solute-binding protein [Oscillospiraceae bacterium]|jgi:putative aldouronate transport system substrate-binding protein|nr:extracellular solute-binding protein [Oscillospiraceae bacterium]